MTLAVDSHSLRDAAIFKNIPEDVLLDFAQHCHMTELPAGSTLMKQDDPGEAMYILLDGQVHIVRTYPNGSEVILDTQGPYYVVGELSMLAAQPRTGSVVAVSDCTLLAVDRDKFMQACTRSPELAQQTLLYLAERLYRMNLHVRESAIGNIAARVASILLLMSGNNIGTIPGSVQISRIARAAAIDADTVENLLHQWSDQGLISMSNQQITIDDLAQLRTIAG